jgi:hypothetical protein
VTLTVNKTTPVVALAPAVTTVLVHNPVTLTATVSSTVSGPTGSVSFYDGTSQTPVATVPLSGGVAVLNTSLLAIGTHSITSTYTGDQNFVTLMGGAVTVNVLDFSLALSTSSNSTTSQTVVPGGTTNFAFTISPTGAATFPAAVTLSVTGLPTGATYTSTPTVIASGAGPTSVALALRCRT